MRSATLARTTLALTTAAASLFPTIAMAGPVPIGASDVVLQGDTSDTQALVGELVGQVQSTFSIGDFSTGKVLLAGTVDQRVILEAEKQSLTFHYLITNTPGAEGAGELFRFSAFSFGEFVESDVDYLIDDAAAGHPSRISRSDDAVDASFDGPDRVLKDGDAISFYVRTNATMFDQSGFAILDALSPINDPLSGNVRSGSAEGLYRAVVIQGPVVVPLPAAVYSGFAGLAAAAWFRRKLI